MTEEEKKQIETEDDEFEELDLEESDEE